MLRHSRNSGLCSHLVSWCCAILLCLGTTQCSPAGASVCPGLQNGVCTGPCQSATCSALASFFNSTFNETRDLYVRTLETHSWANRSGWEISKTQPCQQILSARGRSPNYCSWYGVTCCTAGAAAQQECQSVHSVVEIKVRVNGVNGSVEDPTILQDILQLHACGLTRLNLQGNDLSGSLGSTWGLLTNLTVLDLSNNWINGTIPAALQALKNLTVLSLGQNFLSGPLPKWLGELTALQSLNLGASAGQNPDGSQGLTGALPTSLATLTDLELLNLETNALTGTLPARLCQDSKLSIVKLRANNLTGQFDQLLNCQKLTQLDVSSNNFSGTLPDSSKGWNWSQLVSLDFSNNQLAGSIPDALYGLSVLGYLNLGHNRLSGSIQRSITLMQYLKSLQLNDNQLTGPIDENLWYLPQLNVLDLSHNNLSGTVSKAVGLAFGLEEVDLDNNQLTGSLPAELGLLKDLTHMDVRNNSALSFHGDDNATSSTSDPEQLLPCFLMFSEAVVPKTDGSNMGCPAIIRRPWQEAEQFCSGKGPSQLGDQAPNLANAAEAQQTFEVDPTYYGYQGCQCLGGYRPVWESDSTILTCVPIESKSLPPLVVPVVSVAAGAAVMLLAAAALLVWLRMTVQLRPRWQREKELNENRKKGMPSGGPATIIVTDVESYSDLMQVNAPLTTKAMGIHNAILRKAVAAHAGHVVEQEGDSWSVAFHTPMDAVAFCLQVQQALQKTNWPSDVGGRPSRSRGSFLSNRAASAPPPAATAANGSTRGDGSMLGSTVAAATPLSTPFGGLADNQKRSGSWSQHAQSCRIGSGGSNDLATAAGAQQGLASPHSAAGAAPWSAAPFGPAAGPGFPARIPSIPRSGASGPVFDPLMEDDSDSESKPAFVAPAGGSLDSLMVLDHRNRADVEAAVQPSALSADGLTERLARKWSVWPGFGNKLRGTPATNQQLAQAQQVQAQPQQLSFSSLQSTPSLLASDRAASELSAPALGTPATTPTGSFQNLLHSWRNRVRNTGSSASESDLSGHPAAATGAESAEGAVEVTPLKHAASAAPTVFRYHQGSAIGSAGTARSLSLASQLGPASSGALPGRQQQSSSRFWSMLGMPPKSKGGRYGGHQDGVIRGLRVRIGVATGWVPRSTNIERSALFELAKAVSDMANGGQVLMEANTFTVVRDRLTELGTVDHRGYNDKLRATASRAVMRQQTSCLFGCVGFVGRLLGLSLDSHTVDTDALLLDMGEYFLPTLGPVIPAAAGGEAPAVGVDVSNPLARPSAVPSSAVSTLTRDPSADGSQTAQPTADLLVPPAAQAAEADAAISDAGVSVAAAAVLGSSAVPDLANQCLQLYSILPRTLHERAKLWLNNLTFREGTQQIVKSYFDAPGTGVADLSSSSGVSITYADFDKPPLPAVTMIFAAVDGGKALVRKKPEVARIVHNALGRIIQLLLMPERDGHQDGYLCRQQEGVLKYMLAFREPARAVEWALLLQEVLLHVPWPDEVLQELGTTAPLAQTPTAVQSVTADATGSPRRTAGTPPGGQLKMKIGLAEGNPDSISPDHLGRPDYFGNFVNLAARMMDAAAQGGQVVCSVHLAQKIHNTWCFEAELGFYDPPQEDPIQQQPQDEGQSSPVPSPFAAMSVLASGTPPQQQQQQQVEQPLSFAEIDSSEASGTSRLTAAGATASGTSASNATAAAAAGAGPGSSGSASQVGGMKMSRSRVNLVRQLLNKNVMLLDGPTYPQRLVHISCQHIGTYAFKGCGTLDMLSFTTDFMPAPEVNPAGAKGGKGTLVFPGTGPVVGLQDCPVALPDVLPTLQQAWAATSAAVAAVQAAQQQHQQDRLLLHRVSLKQSPKPYRRSVSSVAAFAATSGELPDGIVRKQAANDLLSRQSLADSGSPMAAAAPAISGSWSGSAGPWSAAPAALQRRPSRLSCHGELSAHDECTADTGDAVYGHRYSSFSDVEAAPGPPVASGQGAAVSRLSAEMQLPTTNGSLNFWPQGLCDSKVGKVSGAGTVFDCAQPRDVELSAKV